MPVHTDQLTKDLAAALRGVMTMDVRGHQLQDRLQFTTPGRTLLDPARSALDTFDARIAATSPAIGTEIPRWKDKHAEFNGLFSELSCAEDEIKALREALDAREAAEKAMVAHHQVWKSSDSCGEFWSWEDVGRDEYEKAAPDKRRILFAPPEPVT